MQKRTGKAARSEVAARIRLFFAQLKDDLDKDSGDFFNRVMEQAKNERRVNA